MKKLCKAFCVLFVLLASNGHAMDGVFDRSAEAEKYIAVMKTGTMGTLAVAAREISVSGIADPRLAAALNERLLSDYQKISSQRADITYGVWMVRALASFGIDEYATTLKTVAVKSRLSKVKAAAKESASMIGWHRTKNQLMASQKYHSDGGDPVVSRLMTLLASEDYAYKRYAAERMNWERILDGRLMQAIAPQVQQYLDRGNKRLTKEQDDTIANFVKLLGYSKDVQYRPLLEKVVAAKNASSGVKRHAKYSLDKLF